MYVNMRRMEEKNKTKTMVKSKATKMLKTKAKKPPMPKRPARFGPVSTINTAPVAIGNSLKGSKPQVIQIADGARVMGRDFAYSLAATAATVNGWENIGSMVLTPAVLCSSVLRNFCQIYNKFKFNRIAVHYITSSPTSQAGDILFYYEKNRYDALMDYSNNNFLNYVLSDVHSVIGPQWSNHSALIVPTSGFKTTSYGVTTDLDDDNQGTIFTFSKTNAASSPGYILIDYDITFKELSINPRAGLFPVVRGLSFQICFTVSTSTTAGTTQLVNNISATAGKLLDNSSVSTNPVGFKGGDVYKCMACVTASQVINTWTNVTPANLLTTEDDKDVAYTIDDGFTFYARIFDSTSGGGASYSWGFYPTAEAAALSQRPYYYGVTATIAYGLNCWATLVHSTSLSMTQAAY